ncbi:MAG: hypothetical protein CMG66_02470 [Candidatus Marinimicrobia bacterium]|nr:hypothetical protein [Candidatus Neomarinimicrobiota bacterium]|tara:strand:- start:29191 stop:30270 length:1080 start_codon:yes stop_codon:yes gene_type:complete
MKKMLLLIISLFVSVSFADEFVTSSTTLGGYGELHYDMEANDGDGKLDFHRFIFYIKHVFNDKWSLMSEIEIEHNMVYSDGDGGYLAMEQAHLNYWDGNWGFKGGVLLVPAGITNEYHEPPTFMSVERPEYNKHIIPTTWFDNGFAFYGNMGDFNWNFTMTGDLDGNGIGAGIRSARMKGVYSKTTDWTKTLQMSWTGMEGLKVGGSVTMNDAPVSAVEEAHSWEYDEDAGTWGAVVTPATEASTIGVQLTEVNATYTKNNLYTRFEYGTIDYTDNPKAESSSGYYLDLGYNIADLVKCDGDLYLWTRTSAYNKDDMGDDTEISLFGVTFKPANNIAIKFETGSKDDEDIMRMGLGYMF